MKEKFPKQVFITGTDTDVGKTILSSILLLGLKGTYFKPIQAGTHPTTDTEWIEKMTELPKTHFIREKYLLKNPLSPHLAAFMEGKKLSLSEITLPSSPPSHPFSHDIIEGAGGLMVPINEREYMIDLIEKLAIPTLLVARSTLGTINHTLLSLHLLKERKIPILGVVLNGPKNIENKKAIEQFGNVRVLAEIPPLDPIDKKSLSACFSSFEKTFSIEG